jgi:hypothetical protein
MTRLIEYIKQDMRDFAWQLSVIRKEYGATPEARSMPLTKSPSLKEAYAELAVQRERVRVLEEALRSVGIPLP